ncbi:tRNA endonuclease ANKZF1 [Salvelinus sp. IW2-2015]|uniref:tRNA endonuclease ANKZF1 n=1 Tax=Salvelinus sp. IW2-2015 TaxID=2691554 RepID=UPI0038D4BD15
MWESKGQGVFLSVSLPLGTKRWTHLSHLCSRRDVLQHKTFHRYTVRAKRGTSQGLRDAKNSSHAPKSAGAALRRYNEAALVKEIQDLLESWTDHLTEASAIFLRAPSHNKSMFLGGKAAPLVKKDPRIRTLPFPTRRATFREIKRVHDVLSTLNVYGTSQSTGRTFYHLIIFEKLQKQLFLCSGLSNREAVASPTAAEDTNQERGGEKNQERRKPKGKKTIQHEEEEPDESWDYGLRDALYTACKTGDLDTLIRLLPVRRGEQGGEEGDQDGQREEQGAKPEGEKNQGEVEESCSSQDPAALNPAALNPAAQAPAALNPAALAPAAQAPAAQAPAAQAPAAQNPAAQNPAAQAPAALSPLALLNQPIDSSGFTLLHVASAAGQKGVAKLLMDAGSDPACKDQTGQTPYIVAPDKDTRNMFRKYMADHPDKYNYSKALVPGPLTAELESKKTEKKKAQKAAKKTREKEQREQRKKLEMEAEEKKKFASLSDREKRAQAAEKRLAEHKASTGGDLSNTR